MTEEQERLCKLIDDHCEAMKAQVMDPHATLEYLFGDEWKTVQSGLRLFSQNGVEARIWYRVPKAPRLVPLDQSDFLGVNRVTHLRQINDEAQAVHLVLGADASEVTIIINTIEFSYLADWECSRDNGATWQACSKPEVSK